MKIEILQRRASLLRELRAFFESKGYWEVQTPSLSRDCCVDAWIEPFRVPLSGGGTGFLQTSPEFALKRLLCQGADRIYEVARVFRQEELGPRHNPEFTMVEWYRCHVDHHLQMKFVEDLIFHLARFTERQRWNHNLPILKLPSFRKMTYAEAFREFADVCPNEASLSELAEAARRTTAILPRGLEQDRDGLLNLLLAEQVEPGFKQLKAVFLHDYPASQAALAKIRTEKYPVAERFELYLDGIEICNGYHELSDPIELQQRTQSQNEKRRKAGLREIPDDSRLRQTMAKHPLPPSSGVALGFDRLAMWCLGCSSIREVIAFPFDEA